MSLSHRHTCEPFSWWLVGRNKTYPTVFLQHNWAGQPVLSKKGSRPRPLEQASSIFSGSLLQLLPQYKETIFFFKKKILPEVGSCWNTPERVCFEEDCYRILEFWCTAEIDWIEHIELFCGKLEYNAENNINNGGLAWEFSKERKDYIRVVYMMFCIHTLWKGNFLCFTGTINNG